MLTRRAQQKKSHPGTTFFIASSPNFGMYTETLCHWTAHRFAYSFGSSLSRGLLLLRIPPVPKDRRVTVLPFLNVFCWGRCSTFPTNIACPVASPRGVINQKNIQIANRHYKVNTFSLTYFHTNHYSVHF